MSAGKYYPRGMILWAAQQEPEKVRESFRQPLLVKYFGREQSNGKNNQ